MSDEYESDSECENEIEIEYEKKSPPVTTNYPALPHPNGKGVGFFVDKDWTVDSHQLAWENYASILTNANTKVGRKRGIRNIRWNQFFKLLVEFKKQNGHCRVTVKHDKFLGLWVLRQRMYHKNGSLREDRKQLLNSIGFDWQLHKSKWEENYQLLKEFKMKNGHCEIKEIRGALKQWIYAQRKAYKGCTLSKERIEKLKAIGIDWQLHKSKWEESYLLLVEFKMKNGHCEVKETTGALRRWLYTQRKTYKRGALSKERIEKLKAIGFDLTPHHQQQLKQKEVFQQQQQQQQKGRAFDDYCRPADDNHLPQQQQTLAFAEVAGTLKQPLSPTRVRPENVTNQSFIEMDDDNVDPNICEEFKEIATYGDPEHWV
eukprot:CAMPEP_0195288698 /NCGR_PEP_ID=MMETSP0707-20130614/5262_1 /TAXON_ID=33640 /ORGANISM="Asterionellopsis glacialis, Strain CCMP134" /LENGTH=372 /DNA_ID=CAMNT_0040348597 /DNA_START=96 /DNA_END=1214 /DNA_ORIENTATION=+